MGFRNAGAKAGAPCSLAMLQGFPDLQVISFAASAECGRTERPWHAGRPHESCECFLGTALREWWWQSSCPLDGDLAEHIGQFSSILFSVFTSD